MASETMRRLDEIVGSFREGVIVRVSCGGMLCGECIQCTARAAKASLQREQRAAQDEIARLARELEAARERARHRERQRDAAEAEVQRLRRALLAVRECADLATARRISGEALYTTIEGDSRMDVETRQGLAAEERRALAADTEGGA